MNDSTQRHVTVDAYLIQCLEVDLKLWELLAEGLVLNLRESEDFHNWHIQGWNIFPDESQGDPAILDFARIVRRSPVTIIAKKLPCSAHDYNRSLAACLPEQESYTVKSQLPIIWLSYDQNFVITLTFHVKLDVFLSPNAPLLGSLLFEETSGEEIVRRDSGILRLLHQSDFGKELLKRSGDELVNLAGMLDHEERALRMANERLKQVSYGDKIVHTSVFLGGDTKPSDFKSIVNCDTFLDSKSDVAVDYDAPMEKAPIVGWSFSVFPEVEARSASHIHAAFFTMQRTWYFLRCVKAELNHFIHEHFRCDHSKDVTQVRVRLCETIFIRYQTMAVAYRTLKDGSPPAVRTVMAKIQGSWGIEETLAETKTIVNGVFDMYQRQLAAMQTHTYMKQQYLLGLIAILQVFSLSSVIFDYYNTLEDVDKDTKQRFDGAFEAFGGLSSLQTARLIEWMPVVSLILIVGMIGYFLWAENRLDYRRKLNKPKR